MSGGIDSWVGKGISIGDSDVGQVPELRDYHPLPNGNFAVETVKVGGYIQMSTASPSWPDKASNLMKSMEFNLGTSGGKEYLFAKGQGVDFDGYEVQSWEIVKEVDKEIDGVDITIFLDRITWLKKSTNTTSVSAWRWLRARVAEGVA